MPRRTLLLAAAVLTIACECESEPGTQALPRPSGSVAAAQKPAVVQQLREAEHRRDSAAVDKTELRHRSVVVRRAAARSLARIADARAREQLVQLLRDEDSEVVVWAAYGLGYVCKDHEERLVRLLVLRATSWGVREAANLSDAERLSPLFAIAQALARCGSSEAEQTLRAWLDEPLLAEEAALALGNLAGQARRLDDASIVHLLDRASEPDEALDHGLYPLSRLPSLSPTVAERLLEVGAEQLEAEGLKRTFALRALGSAGEAAAPVLASAVVDSKYSVESRATASRALRRLGAAGQKALAQVLPKLIPVAREAEALGGAAFGVLWTTLEGLAAASSEIEPVLTELSELPISEGSPPLARRQVRLRCQAAALLAGRASAAVRLLECDPEPEGELGQLARISVLDRGPLSGARGRAWERFARAKQPVVRQAALRLLGQHPEAPGAHTVLAEALAAKEPGTVATAAQLLAAYPERAHEDRTRARGAAPHTSLIKALEAALTKHAESGAIEVVAALMDAAGALQLLSAKPSIERFCDSDQPTLRQHAEQALRLLGDKAQTCDDFSPPKQLPAELASASRLERPIQLAVKTDVGDLKLELDPSWAPVAVARVLDLVRGGYYDSMAVHRVVPGFVVQFGDKIGDGFGSATPAPLRCETSPIPFRAGDVGMALAGRDTAQSQLFVTLDRYPRLDGNYAWLGHAGPGWEQLAQGDRILRIRVRE